MSRAKQTLRFRRGAREPRFGQRELTRPFSQRPAARSRRVGGHLAAARQAPRIQLTHRRRATGGERQAARGAARWSESRCSDICSRPEEFPCRARARRQLSESWARDQLFARPGAKFSSRSIYRIDSRALKQRLFFPFRSGSLARPSRLARLFANARADEIFRFQFRASHSRRQTGRPAAWLAGRFQAGAHAQNSSSCRVNKQMSLPGPKPIEGNREHASGAATRHRASRRRGSRNRAAFE